MSREGGRLRRGAPGSREAEPLRAELGARPEPDTDGQQEDDTREEAGAVGIGAVHGIRPGERAEAHHRRLPRMADEGHDGRGNAQREGSDERGLQP